MGLLEFGIFAVLVLVIAYLIVWVAGKLAPGHPAILDNVIWVLAVLIIVWQLAAALGLHDVAIPRVFR
jgi:hypothetical protein